MIGRYAYRRGKGSSRRVMHITAFDRLGRWCGVLCGSKLAFDTTCNLPLGLPTCKRCLKVEESLA